MDDGCKTAMSNFANVNKLHSTENKIILADRMGNMGKCEECKETDLGIF